MFVILLFCLLTFCCKVLILFRNLDLVGVCILLFILYIFFIDLCTGVCGLISN